MRVLHIGGMRESCVAAGPSHSIRGLATAQSSLGIKVGLLGSLPLARNVKMKEMPGICLLKSPTQKHYNPWLISNEWVRRIVDEFGVPDIVNFHSTYIPFQTALSRRCREIGWPYIITPRGGMTYLAQNLKGIKKKVSNLLYFRSCVKHAAAVHALCRAEALDIEKQFETKKIITVCNGVDDGLLEAPNRLQPAELGDFNKEEDLVLGFVGRIDIYHKGLDLLLEAMSILKNKPNGSKCKLFIVGPYHTKRDEDSLCSLIKKYRLEDVVMLLGPKYDDDKLRYFLACDVFVHTSRFEGMPMAVLEAMAMGKPCLVTPGTNISDMVVEGGGWECKPVSASIAGAIETIQNHTSESIEAAGRKAHELVNKDYRWVGIAKQLKEEYAGITESDSS
jgi:glycosyltransferase involved in cell wall biosynthesis